MDDYLNTNQSHSPIDGFMPKRILSFSIGVLLLALSYILAIANGIIDYCRYSEFFGNNSLGNFLSITDIFLSVLLLAVFVLMLVKANEKAIMVVSTIAFGIGAFNALPSIFNSLAWFLEDLEIGALLTFITYLCIIALYVILIVTVVRACSKKPYSEMSLWPLLIATVLPRLCVTLYDFYYYANGTYTPSDALWHISYNMLPLAVFVLCIFFVYKKVRHIAIACVGVSCVACVLFGLIVCLSYNIDGYFSNLANFASNVFLNVGAILAFAWFVKLRAVTHDEKQTASDEI